MTMYPEATIRKCGVCGLEHATGHHTSLTICVAALKAQLAEMTAERNSEQRWACEYFSETLKLGAQIVALTAQVKKWQDKLVENVQKRDTLQVQLEADCDALADVGKWQENFQQWNLDPKTHALIAECLEARREADFINAVKYH